MIDCSFYSERRSRCYNVYGSNRGEECVHESLTEKRCLSMQRCPRKALEYYGNYHDNNNNNNSSSNSNSNSNIGFSKPIDNEFLRDDGSEANNYQKAICASWAEAFAYVDKELEHGQEVARHHREARRIVSSDAQLRKGCRQIAMELAECLRAASK